MRSSPLRVVDDLKTYFFTRRGVTKAVDGGIGSGGAAADAFAFTVFVDPQPRTSTCRSPRIRCS